MKNTKKSDVLQALAIGLFIYLLFFHIAPFLKNL
jgi:hypothetical protein